MLDGFLTFALKILVMINLVGGLIYWMMRALVEMEDGVSAGGIGRLLHLPAIQAGGGNQDARVL